MTSDTSSSRSLMRDAVMAYKRSAQTKLRALSPVLEPILDVIKTHPKITLAVLGPPSAIVLFLLSLVSLDNLFRVIVTINFFAFGLVFSLLGGILSLIVKLFFILMAIASITALSTAVILGTALTMRITIGIFRIHQRISDSTGQPDEHTSAALGSATPMTTSANPSIGEWDVELQKIKDIWNTLADWWARILPIIESTTIEGYRIALPFLVGTIRVSITVAKAAFVLLRSAFQATPSESSRVESLFTLAPEESSPEPIASSSSEETEPLEGQFLRSLVTEGTRGALPFIITTARLLRDISEALIICSDLIWGAIYDSLAQEAALEPLERQADEHPLDEEFEDVVHQETLIEGKEERQDIQLTPGISEQNLKRRGAFVMDDAEDA